MRRIVLVFVLTAFAIGCKQEKKEATPSTTSQNTILENIAFAHGFQNWRNVEEIAFTFNVDRDSTHFERSWVWNPKTNDVMRISSTDTLRYNRKSMDSIAYKTNGGFINDRYWLLAPFNLLWDKENFTYEYFEAEQAPISNTPMQKLTIVYGSEGGYTPGDAYDFYFEDDYLIKEWVFRKGNQEEPSMATTWENYSTIEGFTLVKDHKRAEGNFNLFIDGISIKLKP